jgi:hypothetical protein
MSKEHDPDTGAPMSSEAQRAIRLLDIVDELDRVRHLIEAAMLCAGALPPKTPPAIDAVLAAASEKLEGACNELDQARPKSIFTNGPAATPCHRGPHRLTFAWRVPAGNIAWCGRCGHKCLSAMCEIICAPTRACLPARKCAPHGSTRPWQTRS